MAKIRVQGKRAQQIKTSNAKKREKRQQRRLAKQGAPGNSPGSTGSVHDVLNIDSNAPKDALGNSKRWICAKKCAGGDGGPFRNAAGTAKCIKCGTVLASVA